MYVGNTLHETDVKRGLHNLDSRFNFDMGGRLEFYHPKIDVWQSVRFAGEQVTSMDRHTCPEHTIVAKEDGEVLKIGWRRTFREIVRKRIGISWDDLREEFDIDINDPMLKIPVPRARLPK